MRDDKAALINVGAGEDVPPLPAWAGGHPRAGAAEAHRVGGDGGGGGGAGDIKQFWLPGPEISDLADNQL